MSIGQDLLNVPFPEMVEKLALGIANAQTALDRNSTAVAKFMAETNVALPKIDNPKETAEYPIISLGFFPGYYQFTEAEVEVKMAISMSKSREASVGAEVKAGYGLVSASVNASYSSKYNYSAEGASRLKVKMAPVPPPAILQRYMEAMIDKMVDAEGNPLPATT